MKARPFRYAVADTVEEACDLLSRHGDDAAILAGGQSLLPSLNLRLSGPSLLIDISRIASLNSIVDEGDRIRVGALTTHRSLGSNHLIKNDVPILYRAVPLIAHVAIRNRGTIGGSLSLADPAAELPACVVACGASITLQSRKAKRSVPADEFFLDLMTTAREPDEILVDVKFPKMASGVRHFIDELAVHRGAFALAGVAGTASIVDATIDELRLVPFGTEPVPRIARRAAEAAAGQVLNEARIGTIVEALQEDLEPMDGGGASIDVKKRWATHLTKQMLKEFMA